MPSITTIVRPSETPNIRPNTYGLLNAGGPVVVDDDDLIWGGPGDSVFVIQAHTQGETKSDEKNETKRTYDVVRVKNPDDTDQHVDVEVLTSYQARNKIDDSRTKLFFDKPKATATTEIISRNNTRTATDT